MNKYSIVCILLLFAVMSVFSEQWPMGPGNVFQEIGNNCYEYQDYGEDSYYHDGIDIMGSGGDPVYAVDDGFLVELRIMDPL